MSEIPQYSQLVLNVCETLQEEVIILFDQTRHSLMSRDPTDDKDSMETDDASRHKQKDQRDGASGCSSSWGGCGGGEKEIRNVFDSPLIHFLSSLSRHPCLLSPHPPCNRYVCWVFT